MCINSKIDAISPILNDVYIMNYIPSFCISYLWPFDFCRHSKNENWYLLMKWHWIVWSKPVPPPTNIMVKTRSNKLWDRYLSNYSYCYLGFYPIKDLISLLIITFQEKRKIQYHNHQSYIAETNETIQQHIPSRSFRYYLHYEIVSLCFLFI